MLILAIWIPFNTNSPINMQMSQNSCPNLYLQSLSQVESNWWNIIQSYPWIHSAFSIIDMSSHWIILTNWFATQRYKSGYLPVEFLKNILILKYIWARTFGMEISVLFLFFFTHNQWNSEIYGDVLMNHSLFQCSTLCLFPRQIGKHESKLHLLP